MIVENSAQAGAVMHWFNDPINATLVGFLGDFVIALAAVVSVMITAKVATRQYREERKEKKKDRALEIRKAVIIDGIRAVSTASNAVFSLTNPEISDAEATASFGKALVDVNTALAVSSNETVSVGRSYLNAVGPIFIVAKRARQRLLDHDSQREIAERMADKQHELNERILEEQRVLMTRKGEDVEHGVGVLQRMFEIGQAHHSESIEERKRARELADEEREGLSRMLFSEISHYQVPGFRLIEAFRKDMEMSENPGAFVSAVRTTPEDVLKLVGEMQTRWDEKLSPPIAQTQPAPADESRPG